MGSGGIEIDRFVRAATRARSHRSGGHPGRHSHGEGPELLFPIPTPASAARQYERVSWSDAELDYRIEEIIVDAYGDDEQLSSFACVLDELLDVPAGATAMGQPVELTAVEDGGARLGLRATVEGPTGKWTVALVDITVDPVAHPEVAMTVAAYRRWLGDGLE